MSKIIGIFTSVVMSCMLIFGEQWMHDFAYYAQVFINVMGWVIVWFCFVKEVAEKAIAGWVLGIPSFAFSLYALASTGHPLLAASSFIVSFLMITISYGVAKGKQP